MKTKMHLTALAVIATAMFASSASATSQGSNNGNCNASGWNSSADCSTKSTTTNNSTTNNTTNNTYDHSIKNSATGGAGGNGYGVGIGVGGNATGGSVGPISVGGSSATGGSSSVRDSGNSSVGNGYGNFSPTAKIEKGAVENTNVNVVAPVAKGGSAKQGQLQGQQQGQQQGQAIVGSGNSSTKVNAGNNNGNVKNSGNNTGTAEVTVGGQSNSMTVNTVDPNSNANAKEAANALRDAAAADAAAKVAAANATAEAIRQAAREPIKNTPSMDAPALTSSNDTCMGSISGSVSLPGFGLGAGTTMIDENCVMLKNSRELWNMGMKAASLARMCMDDKNREALEITGYTCPPVKAKKEAEKQAKAAEEAKVTAVYAGN